MILDPKADFCVDAKHRDLIVLDDDLGILDPKRTDSTQGLRSLANGLAAGVVEPIRRLRDDLDIPYDCHRPLLPLYFARSKRERKETPPAPLGFASDEPDGGTPPECATQNAKIDFSGWERWLIVFAFGNCGSALGLALGRLRDERQIGHAN